MPRPDAYMPVYGNDLLAALDGYDDGIGMSYVRSLWHYWHHTHCEGLPNDDDYLRRVCRQELTSWARVRGIVFGQFFKLEGGRWHQARCRDVFLEASTAYNNRAAGAAAARAARAASDSNSDINADTSDDSNVVDGLQPKSNSKPNSNAEPLLLVADEPRPAKGDDAAWLKSLQGSPAYPGVDVAVQFARMVEWCRVHRKKPTRNRFINWLNRTETTIQAKPQAKKYEPNLG